MGLELAAYRFIGNEEYDKNTVKPKRTCKGICKKFKVKKPTGVSRYGSGQAKCQICDVWIDHKGCHLTDGSAADIGDFGWFCNCCNYRVRRNPRNKKYKEKLRQNNSKEKLASDITEKKIEFESINQNPCPKCGIKPTENNIESVFGMRISNGKSIRQSQCHNCRGSKFSEIEENVMREKTRKFRVDEINRLISKALMLIRKDSVGIYENVLKDELKISENEFLQIIPKLTRLEDIIEESEDGDDENSKKILKSITNKEENKTIKKLKKTTLSTQKSQTKQELEFSFDVGKLEEEMGDKSESDTKVSNKTKEASKLEFSLNVEQLKEEINESKNKISKKYEESEKTKKPINNPNSTIPDSKTETIMECKEVIKYKRRKIDIGLVRELFLEYIELGSIKKVCEKHPWTNEEKIRRHLQTPKRLPKKIQRIAHDLVSDPESSLSIAMYATDYFKWDGNIDDEDKIMNFVKKLQTGFEKNNDLRLKLMGKIK